MKIVAIIVTLVCCGLMFFVKREWKAALLVLGAMTLTVVEVPVIPLHKANYLLPVAFLLSEWKSLPRHFRLLRRTHYLWRLLLLVTFSAILAAMTSRYVSLGRFIQTELLFKYFVLAYAFWAVKDEKSLKPVLRVSLYCLVVMTFFGVLNYVEKSSSFVNALTQGRTSSVVDDVELGSVYAESHRFRVQSMFKWAFDYGFTCAAVLLLHLYAWYRKMEKKIPFIIAIVCCLFGIITCECRIVWACCFMSVGCFYMWCFSLKKIVVVGISVVMAAIIAYSTIPPIRERVDMVTDVFQENSNTGGSSIALREAQMASTLLLMQGHELLGRGQGYWADCMKNETGNIDGLLAVESVVFHYLLERGIIGFVIWVIFYACLFYVIGKRRKKHLFLSGLGASLLVNYLVYAIGTGELGSVYPTLLLLGMVLRLTDSKRINVLLRYLAIIRRRQMVKKIKAALRSRSLSAGRG